jgi:hypothetical protein
MNTKKIVAAILILIPVVAYLALPLYNIRNPEAFGLPFFYWYQIIWLPISGIMFYIAAVLIDRKSDKGGANKRRGANARKKRGG